MHTKYCPHCGSMKIHKVYEEKGIPVDDELYKIVVTHYHECEDCNETWEHHK
jgi:hypothetical protein